MSKIIKIIHDVISKNTPIFDRGVISGPSGHNIYNMNTIGGTHYSNVSGSQDLNVGDTVIVYKNNNISNQPTVVDKISTLTPIIKVIRV